MNIQVDGIAKKFNRRAIFSDVNFEVHPGEVFGITGRNGSGKSTLLKMLGGILTPSKGTITCRLDGVEVTREQLHRHVGFVAPYLVLYDEFSAEENIRLFASVRGLSKNDFDPSALLERVGLPAKRRDPIRAFSSGMKQRMKLIFAIMHSPALLLLDEPISNLDSDGIEIVYDLIRDARNTAAVIVATNDASDIEQCDRTYMLASAGSEIR